MVWRVLNVVWECWNSDKKAMPGNYQQR